MKRGDKRKLRMNLKITMKMKINPTTFDLLLSNVNVFLKLDNKGGTNFSSNASINGKDIISLVNTKLTTICWTILIMIPSPIPCQLLPPVPPGLPNNKPQ